MTELERSPRRTAGGLDPGPGKRITKLNFGRRDDSVLPILRSCPAEMRGAVARKQGITVRIKLDAPGRLRNKSRPASKSGAAEKLRAGKSLLNTPPAGEVLFEERIGFGNDPEANAGS